MARGDYSWTDLAVGVTAGLAAFVAQRVILGDDLTGAVGRIQLVPIVVVWLAARQRRSDRQMRHARDDPTGSPLTGLDAD